VIAAAGLPSVQVAAAPRIMVVSTGDELIEPGEPILDWQIRRSNAYAVLAALHGHGFAELGDDHLPDDLATLRTRLTVHLDTHDVLILSGGVSMGRFDLVPQVLAELGVQVIFHKIAQRPGKPMWFGVRADGKAVYALPGNPVSTLICLRRYVLQGLYIAMGAQARPAEAIALHDDFDVKPALSVLLPVTLKSGAAVPHPTRGSGDFISLLGTDGFVELPPGPRICRKGELTALYRW
jgi:molybdopterin molybdotransferase